MTARESPARADEGDALDALFAEYLAALEDRANGAGAPSRAQLTASFAARAGPLLGPFLRRARLLGRLAELGRPAEVESGGNGAGVPSTEVPATLAGPERAPWRVGRYEVVERIGTGGASRVLRARDPLLQRDVALKLLDHGARADAREFLLNDARALGRLEHRSIVRVLDVDSDGEHDWVVMEWVRGPSLAAVVGALAAERDGAGPAALDVSSGNVELARSAQRLRGLPARVRLVERLALALDVCHRRGVVHRDVKPSNVLVRPDGEPVLIDFGIAHFSGSGAGVTENLVGTPAYLAPEQVASSRTGASPASDQFSLGVVLYELLTLQQPFQRATREETLAAVLEADVAPPSAVSAEVTRDLERLCLHALEREPEQRYPSLAAFAADLTAARELRPLSLPEPTALAPLLRRLRRHKRRIAGVAAVVVAVSLAWSVGGRALRAREIDATLARLGQGERTPTALHTDAAALLEVARALRDLVADPLGRAIAGERPRRVDQARKLWSRELAGQIASDAADHRDRGTSMRWGTWRKLLALDERVNPRGVLNLRDRQRGMLHLPAGVPAGSVRLEEHRELGPRDIASDLRDVPFDERLAHGFYRITLRDPESGAPLRQVDFRVRPADADALPRRLDLPPVRPGFFDSAVAVAERTLHVEGIDERGARAFRVPATWISRDVVRVRDIVPWLLERRPFDALGAADVLDLDAPALLTWDQATEFAQWSGLRLPTALEWHAAALDGGLELPGREHLAGDRAEGVDGEFLAGALVEGVRAPCNVEYEPFFESAATGSPDRVTPAQWARPVRGRPDGVTTKLPPAVREAIAQADSEVYAELVSQAYRTSAFRLATHVAPPAP